MVKLEQLLPCSVAPPQRVTRVSVDLIEQPLAPSHQSPPARYEAAVFNFLLANRVELGVKSLVQFRGLLMDGAVDLTNGDRIAVEIKYKMNWLKACQAEWQFRRCLMTSEAQAKPIAGGLVFFEEFSGDWARVAGGRRFHNGWYHWYTGHCDVEGRRLDLVRFDSASGVLEWCPLPVVPA